jgi:DNA ligase 1
MKFSEFSKYLQKLESTSKRLEMMTILAELIEKLSPNETAEALYLSMGYLSAPFENIKTNIAEKMLQKTLVYAYATTKEPDITKKVSALYEKTGDIGSAASELASKHSSDLTILEVHKKLLEIALTEGSGSQDLKIKKTGELLKDLDKVSVKYIARILLGTMRLGFTEITIAEALAQFLGDRKLKTQIEQKYNIRPDIGLVAETLKKEGLKGLDKIHMETGVPVLSQKAQRVADGMDEIVERMKTLWTEFKLDGIRAQLHMDVKKESKSKGSIQTLFSSDKNKEILVKTYTRNLEETTHMYPEITKAAKEHLKAESVILDGEAIGYDQKTGAFLPFQEIMQRKRKHDIKETAKKIPLQYYVFDILFLDGKSLIEKPLKERKKILQSIVRRNDVIKVVGHQETKDPKKLTAHYENAKEKNLEGLIIKNPEDPYQAGARSYSWIKLKTADETLLEDSVDCVVLGYYHGKGVRTKFGLGGFLAGIFDEKTEKFKTITKVGTGLTEDMLVKLKEICDKEKVKEVPKNVDMESSLTPDVIINPKIIVEIGADEITISPRHTSKYALRFPRLLKIRKDKSAKEATSVEEIKKMYKAQGNGK